MRLLKLIPDNTNIPFMRWRLVALALSLLLIAGSVGLLATRGLNLGVDFVGGQLIQAKFAGPAPIEQVRERINALDLGDANIQEFGRPDTVAIRMALPSGDSEAAAEAIERVKGAVAQAQPGVTFPQAEAVSGEVSRELARDGGLALLLAILGIAIYIWFRFEWQFGVGAILTLFHDVAITLGFFALTQLEVNLNVVAAFLTIVGYSLNDTVVVYDRIRENLRKYRKMEIVPLIDLSLNETLSRTIVTSLSIMLALAILLFVGPDVIFGLAAAILFGAIIGTYSTIYVSAPMLIWLGVGPNSFVPTAAPGDAERVATRTP
ncbi:MAG: Protein translocase subunit SecF [uncultured Sphingomonadaceae bacterium]|uniref:Protein-export membrane protein SecF n=1 Tax=uncultured Sphingomonadaceae bacterium TaxID=169976 RepID=A0A6J4U0G3_9SPHN|nr:MAG: Protein translocase subunit SecF [uncultured Sphingomonadaceae bacterium]